VSEALVREFHAVRARFERVAAPGASFVASLALKCVGRVGSDPHPDGRQVVTMVKKWKGKKFNARHGHRFRFVYTPKHASCMNQVEIPLCQGKLHPYGPKPALDFRLCLGMMRARVDQGHAQLGADQRQLLAAVRGTVVHEKPLGHASSHQRFADRGGQE
jgi:hypothetical protein